MSKVFWFSWLLRNEHLRGCLHARPLRKRWVRLLRCFHFDCLALAPLGERLLFVIFSLLRVQNHDRSTHRPVSSDFEQACTNARCACERDRITKRLGSEILKFDQLEDDRGALQAQIDELQARLTAFNDTDARINEPQQALARSKACRRHGLEYADKKGGNRWST
jgi:hypothetical protein